MTPIVLDLSRVRVAVIGRRRQAERRLALLDADHNSDIRVAARYSSSFFLCVW